MASKKPSEVEEDPPSDPEERAHYEARRRDKQLQGALAKKSAEELFELFDVDNSGFIDFDEFKALLPQLGKEMSEAKAVRYFQLVDEDGSGQIDLEEFRTTLFAMDPVGGNPLGFAPIDTLSPFDVFQLFDGDNSGEIDEDEFADLLDYMKIDVKDEKQEKLFSKYDVDGSGNITYDEFKCIWVKVCNVKTELRSRKIKFRALTPRVILEKKLLACLDGEEDGEAESMVHAQAYAVERKRKARLRGMLKLCKKRAREQLRTAIDICGQVYVFGRGTSRQFAAPCRDDAFVGFPRVKKLFEARVDPDKVIADEKAANAAAAASTHVDEKLLVEREIEGVDDAVGKNFRNVVCNTNCAYLWGRRVVECAIGESVIFARSDDGSVYCWGGYNDPGHSPTAAAKKLEEEANEWKALLPKPEDGGTAEYVATKRAEAERARRLFKRKHRRDGAITPRSNLLLSGDRDDGRLNSPRRGDARNSDASSSAQSLTSEARRKNAESRAQRRRGSRGSAGSASSRGSGGSAATKGSGSSLGSAASERSGRRGSAGSGASGVSRLSGVSGVSGVSGLPIIADGGSDGDEDDDDASEDSTQAEHGHIDAAIIKQKLDAASAKLKHILIYFDRFEPPPNNEARFDFFEKVLMPKVTYDDLTLALDLRGKKFEKMNVAQLTDALGAVLAFEVDNSVDQRELFRIQSMVALHRDRNGPAYKPILAKKARKLFAEKWLPLIELEANAILAAERKEQMKHVQRVQLKENKYSKLRAKVTSARGHMTPVAQRETSMATKLSVNRKMRDGGQRIRFGGITARGPRNRIFRGAERVAMISAAGHHASLVHELSGDVYSWGVGTFGQLGIDPPASYAAAERIDAKHPTRLATLTAAGVPIDQVCCGFNHSIARVKGGRGVVVWGSNTCGQLGLGMLEETLEVEDKDAIKKREIELMLMGAVAAAEARRVSSLVKKKKRQPTHYEVFAPQPVLLRMPFSSSTLVRNISAGNAHTALCTESGDVYVWGCTDGGRLGLGLLNVTTFPRPTRVEALRARRVKISDVSCGCTHTVLVTPLEEVLADGLNEMQGGEVYAAGPAVVLGRDRPAFERIMGPLATRPVANISAGYTHTGAVTVGGELYTWGRNFGGCAGHPTPEVAFLHEPAVVKALYIAPRMLSREPRCRATQSSTYRGYLAAKALRGNRDGSRENQLTHTLIDSEPWWDCDLGEMCVIEKIVVWNRSDKPKDSSRPEDFYTARLFPVWMMASLTPFGDEVGAGTLTDAKQRASAKKKFTEVRRDTTWEMPSNVVARYIRIQLEQTTYLHVAGIEIYGTEGLQPSLGKVNRVHCGHEVTAAIIAPCSNADEIDISYQRAVRADASHAELLRELPSYYGAYDEHKYGREIEVCPLCRAGTLCELCNVYREFGRGIGADGSKGKSITAISRLELDAAAEAEEARDRGEGRDDAAGGGDTPRDSPRGSPRSSPRGGSGSPRGTPRGTPRGGKGKASLAAKAARKNAAKGKERRGRRRKKSAGEPESPAGTPRSGSGSPRDTPRSRAVAGVPALTDGVAGIASDAAAATVAKAAAAKPIDPLLNYDPEDPLKVGRMKSLAEIIDELLAVKPPPVEFVAREKNKGTHENAVKAKAKRFLKKFTPKRKHDSDSSNEDSSSDDAPDFAIPSSEDEEEDF